MRGHDHVGIRRSGYGERRISKREQADLQRNVERFGGMRFRHRFPFVGNRFVFGRVRTGRSFVRSRRVRFDRTFARLIHRHFPDGVAKLAFFGDARAVHVHLRRLILMGRSGLPRELRDSRRRLLLRIVLRRIPVGNPFSWRNGEPYGHERVLKRSEQRNAYGRLRVFVQRRNGFENGCRQFGGLPIRIRLEFELVDAGMFGSSVRLQLRHLGEYREFQSEKPGGSRRLEPSRSAERHSHHKFLNRRLRLDSVQPRHYGRIAPGGKFGHHRQQRVRLRSRRERGERKRERVSGRWRRHQPLRRLRRQPEQCERLRFRGWRRWWRMSRQNQYERSRVRRGRRRRARIRVRRRMSRR